jgi:hypothetical protein
MNLIDSYRGKNNGNNLKTFDRDGGPLFFYSDNTDHDRSVQNMAKSTTYSLRKATKSYYNISKQNLQRDSSLLKQNIERL